MLSIALQMCIMAGCDHVKSLLGIGLNSAHKRIKITFFEKAIFDEVVGSFQANA